MRKDHGEVTLLSDHRMSSVGFALSGPTRRMGMDIGDDLEFFLRTGFPKGDVAASVKANNAGVKAVGIKVVIADEVVSPTAREWAKQECPAFTPIGTSLSKRPDKTNPEQPADLEVRVRDSHQNEVLRRLG